MPSPVLAATSPASPPAPPSDDPPAADRATPAALGRLPFETLDDLEPVFRCNRAAVDHFAEHVGPILHAVVRVVVTRRKLSPDFEGDLVNEVWLALFRDDFAALRKWDPRRGPLEGYLRPFAHSRALDHLRRGQRLDAVGETALAAHLERSAAPPPPVDTDVLDEALRLYQRECTREEWRFLLCTAEGRETEELMEEFGLSAANVYKRRQRLRDRLTALRDGVAASRRGKKT